MQAQIQPNRLVVSDRFPMLGFTVRTSEPPLRAEIAIATDPALFADKAARKRSNFFSSREIGELSIQSGQAVYVVPAEILARFIGAQRLYFALAVGPLGGEGALQVVATPTKDSPYISISGLSGRSLRRVRLFPARTRQSARSGNGYGVGGEQSLVWAGDTVRPGMERARTAPEQESGAQKSHAPNGQADASQNGGREGGYESFDYDDGFGPLPPSYDEPDAETEETSADVSSGAPVETAQYAPHYEGGNGASSGLGVDPFAVEVKYRMFIPAPVIKGPPLMDDFGGDGRGFSYDGGTSRGEIRAIVHLASNGAIESVNIKDRHWTASTAYDSDDTFHVSGKPSWWLDKREGARVKEREGVRATDDNLNIVRGASGRRAVRATVDPNIYPVTIRAAANNALVTVSPDIDVDVTVFFRNHNGLIQAQVDGYHDGFPAHELYVNGEPLYRYDPVAADNGPGSLFGTSDTEASSDWVTVARAYTVRTGGQALAFNESFTVNWDDVQSIPQPTNKSCWAAAGAMVVGWRDQISLTPETIAKITGGTTATGLNPAEVGTFANDLGLVAEPPQSYTKQAFRELIEDKGPLWVAADVPGLHAIVVTGVYNDEQDLYVRVTDPWDRAVGTPGAPGPYANTHQTGSRYILKWEDFVAEYERAATNYASVNLQILHSGGVNGRQPNRGEQVPPGYAQSHSERRYSQYEHGLDASPPYRQPAYGQGAGGGGSPSGITRIWTWSHGLIPRRAINDANNNWWDRRTNLGMTDYVVSLNDHDFSSGLNLRYRNRRASTPVDRWAPLCSIFEKLSAKSITPHLMVFLEPDPAMIREAAEAIQEFMSVCSVKPRSIQLDLEGWWTRKPAARRRAGEAAIEQHFYTDWTGDKPELGIGVTHIASTPQAIRGALGKVDFGIPQIYGSERNYGRPIRARSVRRHFARTAEALGAGKKIFVGQTARGRIVTPQIMHDMLAIVADLSHSNTGRVTEIAFWSDLQLLRSTRNRNYFKRLTAKAKSGGLSASNLPNPSRGAGRSGGAQAQSLSINESFTINWDEVELMAQPTELSCWATAGAMVVGWRNRQSLTADTIADIANRTTAIGLDPAKVKEFADALDLVAEYPQSYTPQGFRDLLEDNGPLWVGAAVPSLHVVVVTGMYNKDGQIYVRVTDPWDREAGTPGAPGPSLPTHESGSRYIMKWEDFVAEYEAAAEHPRVGFQILHAGGVGDRKPNRGAQTPPGYAQSLSADRENAALPGLEIASIADSMTPPAIRPVAAAVNGELEGDWQALAHQQFGPEIGAAFIPLGALAAKASWTFGIGLDGDAKPGPDDIAGSGVGVGADGMLFEFGAHKQAAAAAQALAEEAETNDAGPSIIFTATRGAADGFSAWTSAAAFQSASPVLPGGIVLLNAMRQFHGASFALNDIVGTQAIESRIAAVLAELEAAANQQTFEFAPDENLAAAEALENEAEGAERPSQQMPIEHEVERQHPDPQVQHGSTPNGQPPNGGTPPPDLSPLFPPPGVQITRTQSEANGVAYDLAQMSGAVMPTMPPAVAQDPTPGERIAVTEWPYIDGPGGRTRGGLTIDWKYGAGGVSDIRIGPEGGQSFDGWQLRVKADIEPGPSTAAETKLNIVIETTFMREGEAPQIGVSEVVLCGSGKRMPTRHHDASSKQDAAA